jgi:hypothetical protein
MKTPLENTGSDVRIILKWILRKYTILGCG